MKSDLKIKNIFSIAILMFGTLVGAGFASGKEIWVYFAKWGNISFLMIFLTALMFFLCCLLFFKFGKMFSISSVQQSNSILFKRFSFLFEFLFIFSNVLLLSSMFAGADSLFLGVLNINYRLFSVISALICVFVVSFGFSALSKTNAIIVPLLFVFIIVIFCFKICGEQILPFEKSLPNQVFGGLLYSVLFVCSNMFFSGFIFSKIGSVYSKKELTWGSVLGAVLLFLSLFLMTFLLLQSPESVSYDMPILYLATNISKGFGFFVLFVVWFGLLTTAFAILFTITNWLKSYVKNTFLCCFGASILALCLSGIGFSSFVLLVYPFIGALGFVYIIFVCFVTYKHNIIINKK